MSIAERWEKDEVVARAMTDFVLAMRTPEMAWNDGAHERARRVFLRVLATRIRLDEQEMRDDAELLAFLQYRANHPFKDTVISSDHEDGVWLAEIQKGEHHLVTLCSATCADTKDIRVAIRDAIAAQDAYDNAVRVAFWRTSTALNETYR